MINTKIRKLEDEIIETLNKSDVPIEAKRLIISDVLHIVTKEADKGITLELSKGDKDGIHKDNLGK